MSLLETQNLTYVYSEGTPFKKTAIENIGISIEKGELIGIIGHTGSGKSTLVQHLNGLLKPTSGKVLLGGEDIAASKESLRKARFRVGLCFQYPEYQLFESTVARDIAFGPKNMGLSEDEIRERVHRAAEFVDLKPELLEKSPFDLSGGEKRRAAIAGVMAMEPEVLILDEPTAGLDPRGRAVITDMIENYRIQTGNTVLMVSHSMEDVAAYASRVLVMNHGRVELFGTVDEVYADVARLEKIGLNVPQITKIFTGLKNSGIAVRSNIYTVEQGKNEILRLLSEKNGGAPA